MKEKFKRAFDWQREDTEEMAWILAIGAIVLLGVCLL